uniref:Uncharacterized protein n=1 Tax=Populus trichocarpa TaxID=3694 RepID=A9PI16_POPTR|nr:unknown [Populus trichocarpa]
MNAKPLKLLALIKLKPDSSYGMFGMEPWNVIKCVM